MISGWFRQFQTSGFSASGDEEDWEERTAFFLLPSKSHKQRPGCKEETSEVQPILIIHGSLCPKVASGASQVVLVVKNPSTNAEDLRDVGSIPGLGRSPREGNSNSLQYSCLENFIHRGAWQIMVHGVVKNQT